MDSPQTQTSPQSVYLFTSSSSELTPPLLPLLSNSQNCQVKTDSRSQTYNHYAPLHSTLFQTDFLNINLDLIEGGPDVKFCKV